MIGAVEKGSSPAVIPREPPDVGHLDRCAPSEDVTARRIRVPLWEISGTVMPRKRLCCESSSAICAEDHQGLPSSKVTSEGISISNFNDPCFEAARRPHLGLIW